MSTDKYLTAIHEAAHAVVLYRTTGAANGYTTITPSEGYLGAAGASCSDSFSSDHMEGEILSCYAGGAAQRRHTPASGTEGCDVDDDLASAYLAQQGWVGREAEFRCRAEALVEQHWLEICAVADELLRTPTLDETEVEILADAAADNTLHDAPRVLAQYRRLRDRSE